MVCSSLGWFAVVLGEVCGGLGVIVTEFRAVCGGFRGGLRWFALIRWTRIFLSQNILSGLQNMVVFTWVIQ